MSGIVWCKICGEIIYVSWPRIHVCLPLFEIWCPDEDGKPEFPDRVRGKNHTAAAEKWAEEGDDYSTPRIAMGDRHPVIHVRQCGEDAVKRFKVSGSFVQEYYAEELTGEGDAAK